MHAIVYFKNCLFLNNFIKNLIDIPRIRKKKSKLFEISSDKTKMPLACHNSGEYELSRLKLDLKNCARVYTENFNTGRLQRKGAYGTFSPRRNNQVKDRRTLFQ